MKRRSKDNYITLQVEWGYETHALEVEEAEWEKIRAGKKIALDGPGYSYEGEHFQDVWHFNSDPTHTLLVTYGHDGETGYEGAIEDAILE